MILWEAIASHFLEVITVKNKVKSVRLSEKYEEQLNKLKDEKAKYEAKLTSVNNKIKEVNNNLSMAIKKERAEAIDKLFDEIPLSTGEIEALIQRKEEVISFMKNISNASENMSENKDMVNEKTVANGIQSNYDASSNITDI